MTETSRNARPVTIVVPVYGDLPGLLECIRSLRQNLQGSPHNVLLVNDCGPDADAIERAVLAAIDGAEEFSYHRNERNLGFVGTCNRAALELDTTSNDILLLNSDTVTTPGFVEELVDVLHASPDHGIVCARSNNATIASLPHRLRDPAGVRTAERTAAVHAALLNSLPRFNVAPVAMGFCFLVRRELIQRYGLFDEVFAPGYGEENDFCLRMKAHGYLSVIAHRALVFHSVGKSFEPARRARLRAAHERLLVKRHPDYPEAVQRYLRIEADPVDVFADVLVPGDGIRRILVDCAAQPTAAEAAMLRAADRTPDAHLRVSVCVPSALRRRTARAYPNLEVLSPDRVNRVWDLAAALTPSVTAERLARLTAASPRVAFPAAGETEPSADILGTLLRASEQAVDIDDLRNRWNHNGAQLAAAGTSLVPRATLGSRAVRFAERALPGVYRAGRRLVRRS